MAQNATQVHIKRGLVYTGPYTASGGAATLVEVGHTDTPAAEISATAENFDLESDQSQGFILTVPVRQSFDIKIPMLESTARLMEEVMGQPAGTAVITGPNSTVPINDRVLRLHQVMVETEGDGTTGLRTFKFWRCQYTGIEPIQIGKSMPQRFIATLRVLRDDTTSAAQGKYFQRTDA